MNPIIEAVASERVQIALRPIESWQIYETSGIILIHRGLRLAASWSVQDPWEFSIRSSLPRYGFAPSESPRNHFSWELASDSPCRSAPLEVLLKWPTMDRTNQRVEPIEEWIIAAAKFLTVQRSHFNQDHPILDGWDNAESAWLRLPTVLSPVLEMRPQALQELSCQLELLGFNLEEMRRACHVPARREVYQHLMEAAEMMVAVFRWQRDDGHIAPGDEG